MFLKLFFCWNVYISVCSLMYLPAIIKIFSTVFIHENIFGTYWLLLFAYILIMLILFYALILFPLVVFHYAWDKETLSRNFVKVNFWVIALPIVIISAVDAPKNNYEILNTVLSFLTAVVNAIIFYKYGYKKVETQPKVKKINKKPVFIIVIVLAIISLFFAIFYHLENKFDPAKLYEGNAYNKAGAYDKAIETYKNGLKDQPKSYGFNTKIASTYLKKKDLENALKYYSNEYLIENDEWHNFKLGLLYYELGRCDDAIRTWKSFKGDNYRKKKEYCVFYDEEPGRCGITNSIINGWLFPESLNPKIRTFELISLAYIKKRDFDKAIEYLNIANEEKMKYRLKGEETITTYYPNFVKIYSLKGDVKTAKEFLDKYKNTSNGFNSNSTETMQAYFFYAQKDYKNAGKNFKEKLGNDEKIMLGDIYMKQKKYSKAKEIYENILKYAWYNYEANYNLGVCYSKLGNKKIAEKYFNIAASLIKDKNK